MSSINCQKKTIKPKLFKAGCLFGFDDVVQNVREYVESVVSAKLVEVDGCLSKTLSRCAKDAIVRDEADTLKVLIVPKDSSAIGAIKHDKQFSELFLLNITRPSPLNSTLTANRCGLLHRPCDSNDKDKDVRVVEENI